MTQRESKQKKAPWDCTRIGTHKPSTNWFCGVSYGLSSKQCNHDVFLQLYRPYYYYCNIVRNLGANFNSWIKFKTFNFLMGDFLLNHYLLSLTQFLFIYFISPLFHWSWSTHYRGKAKDHTNLPRSMEMIIVESNFVLHPSWEQDLV